MQPGLEAAGVSGDDHRQAVVLVGVGLGMLVDHYQSGVVEQVAVAFRRRFHLRDQIRELLNMPAADVAENAHAARRLDLAVGVFVVALRGVPEPREARQPLALRQHVGSHARLPRRERVHQQVALQLRDARPVAHVAALGRALHRTAVLGW